MALFSAYFADGLNPASHEVLLQKYRELGLDPVRARAILQSDAFADEVRQVENFYTSHGIHSVPANPQ